MNRVWSAVVGLAVAAPFYWLLIDTTSSPELYAGGAAAVLAAVAYSAGYYESTENAAIGPRWLGAAFSELAKVPLGVLIVCAEVLAQTRTLRPRRGVLQVEPFATSDGGPHDLGRRALAEAFRSLAPNTIAIGVDSDHDRLLLHRLGPRR